MLKNQLIKQKISLNYNLIARVVSYSSSCIKPAILLLSMLVLGAQLLLAQQKRVFLIGNSVTDGVNYDGLDALASSRSKIQTTARHMIPGSPLQLLWESRNGTSGFTTIPFGFPQQAFTNYQWDNITLQPFDRLLEGTDGDLEMINNYINLAKTNSPNVQFHIFARYPRTPGDVSPSDNTLTAATWNNIWNTTYVDDWGGARETKDYFEKLLVRVKATSVINKPVLIVPCGDVMKALNDKMAAGQIPGYTKIWQVYADGIHMNNIGSYILACTFYASLYKDSPVGIGVPTQYGAISSTLANAIQQTVWEVVSNHPYAGISTAGMVAVTGVTLSQTNTAVAINQNFQLTATIAPSNASNQAVNWSSSNSTVATVSSSGVITGVLAGNATITATTTDGSFAATCLVNVSASNIAVTSVAVLPTTLSVRVGNSSTLSATVSPNNATNTAVNWSSSNDAIVLVDATGKVTAVSAGNATITATTQSDNKTATCAFTSLANAAPTAVITATPITGTSPLVVNFSSAGSADSDAGDFILGYEWDFGDGSAIDKSAGPTHTFLSGGTFIVKLKVMDNNNLFGAQVTQTITVIQGTSNNIATSGAGAIWQDIPAATPTSNSSKLLSSGINDANLTTDVVATDVNNTNNWQAAGTTWTTAQNGITSVKYYNGTTNSITADNGIFSAGIKLQSSIDGITWQDENGWNVLPTYPYDVTASNQIYTFSGAMLNNVRGIRVIGQVRTAANEYQTSWAIKVKEIEVIKTAATTPVNLVSFSVKAIANRARINFATELETNNNYFKVEKSTDGLNFTLLGKINAKGNNSSYFIYDVAPANGVNYYRLTQYDLNGDFENLGIRQLSFSLGNSEISVYPIPNSGNLFVNLNNFEAKQVKVSLSKLNGKIIYTQNLDANVNNKIHKINLAQKPEAGVYMLQLTAPGLYKTYKVIFN